MDSSFRERLSQLETRFKRFQVAGNDRVQVAGSLRSGFVANIDDEQIIVQPSSILPPEPVTGVMVWYFLSNGHGFDGSQDFDACWAIAISAQPSPPSSYLDYTFHDVLPHTGYGIGSTSQLTTLTGELADATANKHYWAVHNGTPSIITLTTFDSPGGTNIYTINPGNVATGASASSVEPSHPDIHTPGDFRRTTVDTEFSWT